VSRAKAALRARAARAKVEPRTPEPVEVELRAAVRVRAVRVRAEARTAAPDKGETPREVLRKAAAPAAGMQVAIRAQAASSLEAAGATDKAA
jgi:hypothetical protein